MEKRVKLKRKEPEKEEETSKPAAIAEEKGKSIFDRLKRKSDSKTKPGNIILSIKFIRK